MNTSTLHLRVVAPADADPGPAGRLWWWRGSPAAADADPAVALPPPCRALQRLGWRTDAAPACHNLVHLVIPAQRHGLLWCADAGALADWLAAARPDARLPPGCVLVSPPPQEAQVLPLQAQGVAAWLPVDSSGETIAATLRWARSLALGARQPLPRWDERQRTERA